MGSKEGVPISYVWAMPSLMPVFLPWLAILGLLALKPNRCGAAWLVLVPLALIFGGDVALRTWGESELIGIPSELRDMLGSLVAAMAFGLAAVWLLASRFAQWHRALIGLASLGIQLLFGGVALAVAVGFEDTEILISLVGQSFMLGVFAFMLSLALLLVGLICRRRFSVASILTWLLALLLAGWFLLAAPFCLIAVVSSGSSVWGEMIGGVLMMALGSFMVCLPFLLLSFANSFHRERLRALLKPTAENPLPPALPSAPVPVQPA
ncbi:MAG: hypothetical protein HZA90_04180 [Verrucomicrobia bacterium]|nr:hypothetical protein [Verrucomicrobiota bacterium]